MDQNSAAIELSALEHFEIKSHCFENVMSKNLPGYGTHRTLQSSDQNSEIQRQPQNTKDCLKKADRAPGVA